MIEIILLIFLTKSIGKLAAKKGLPPGRWKFIVVMAWIGFEMIGMIIGMTLLGTGNLFGLMTLCLASAFGGYLLVRYILENKQDDKSNDDINRIGTDQLRP